MRELALGSTHSRDTISMRLKEGGGSLRRPGVQSRVINDINVYNPRALCVFINAKRSAGLTYREIAQCLIDKKSPVVVN